MTQTIQIQRVEPEEIFGITVRYSTSRGTDEIRLSTDVVKLYRLPHGGYIVVVYEDFKVFFGQGMLEAIEAYLEWLENEKVEIISWGWIKP
jgi:hypothetical protein